MRVSLLVSTSLLAAACSAPSTPDGGHPHDAVTSLRFKAKVGTRDFACGQTYTVGQPATPYEPRDFRLYVHDLRLVSEEREEVPFVLTDDGTWQRDGVAMLDFEDQTGACSNGTAATHTELTGLAPGGHYEALRLTLGVPFAQNHQDATTALPPLNSSALFWNWLGGYKFLRAEGLTPGQPMGHNLHVGSTGCVAGATPNSVDHCDNPNRVTVELVFNPDQDAVVVDVGAVLAGSDLDTNAPGTPPGCMAAPTDADCAPIFERLGLPFGSNSGQASAQVLFRRE